MFICRLFLLLSLFMIVPAAFSKSTFDLLFHYGYTEMRDHRGTFFTQSGTQNNQFLTIDKQKGGNLGISGIYSFLDSSMISPVVGLLINLNSATFSTSVENINSTVVSTIGQVGLKFTPLKELNIYGLGNFGYSPLLAMTIWDSNDVLVNRYNNNYLYGANIIALYEFFSQKSLGLGFAYNKIYFSGPVKIQDADFIHKANYNDFAVNLYFAIHW